MVGRAGRWSTRTAGGGSGARPAGSRSGRPSPRRCAGGSRRRRSPPSGSSSTSGCRCGPPAGASRASVGVDLAGPHAAVVAVGAVLGGVAARAERAASAATALWRSIQSASCAAPVQPARRDQLGPRERRHHPPVGLGEVAGRAGALGSTLGRAAHRVAGEAPRHPRELIARRQLQLGDLPVALPALDVPRQVLRVGEAEVRGRDDDRRDLARLAGLGADVAEGALAHGGLPGADVAGMA